MQSVIRLGVVCVLIACVFLAACQREPTPASTSTSKSTTTVSRPAVDKTLANQLVATPAWLRERLPDDTIAYIRIPSPWSLISAPDGRTLDPLFANEAHVKMI